MIWFELNLGARSQLCQYHCPIVVSIGLFIWFLVIPVGLWEKADCGFGGFYSQTSFIYKYETSCGFIKWVSGGCFVLINKWL